MKFIEAIILGIVQGLTEFLPVSSSGHLVLFQDFFGLEDMLLFDVLLHAGTLLAVVLVFWRQILGLFKPPYKTLLYLIIATVPAALLMFFLRDVADNLFGGTFLCFGFLFTAVLLFTTELLVKSYEKKKALQPAAPDPANAPPAENGKASIDWKTALAMGVAQGIAALPPGVSRSGSTICTGVLMGKKRKDVADFSFLMSIPVIAGSALVTVYELITGTGGEMVFGAPEIIAGMVFAFIFGVIAIKLMLKVIEKCNYKWFALYLAVLAIIVFIHQFVTPIW